MIDTLIALFIATLCTQGTPIDNWYEYARDVDLHTLSASVRIAAPGQGVRWIWLFDDNVLFVTNPDSDHGYCARELND